MSENKLQYEYEAWLLPYKPLNQNEETSKVLNNLYPNFETNDAGVMENEIRDGKNRRILSKKALFEDKSGKWPDDIPGLDNVQSPNGDQIPSRYPGPSSISVSTSISAPSSIPVSTNIPGLDNIPDHKPFLGTTFVPTSYTDPSTSSIPAPRKNSREKKQKGQKVKLNPLQRKFEKAFATPVIMSKAESMMLKMGWSGGALGKTGDGIIEPIAPNLAYATSTKGFGQAPPLPKPTKKAPIKPVTASRQPKTCKQKVKLENKEKKQIKDEKKQIKAEKRQQRIELNKNFNENVKRYILEFVRNEREIAVLFDKDLHNGQRKKIHCIVETIRKLGESGVKNQQMNEGSDRLLLLNIAKENRYVLQTQSEGEHPFRYLCLFKEAPESMYLVTQYKLNDKENDLYVKEVTVQHRTSRKKRKEKRTEKWLVRNARTIVDANCSIDKDCEINKDSDTNTVRKIVDDSDKDEDEKDSESENGKDCGSEDENYSESEDDKDCESENEIDRPDEVMSEFDETINFNEVTKTSNKQIKVTTNIEEEIKEIVERTAAGACTITKTDEVLEINKTRPDIDNNPAENRAFKTRKSVIENIIESIKREDIIQTKDTEDKIEQKIDTLNPNDDTAVKISILTSSRKEFMRYNLNMCFSDFIAMDVFKEFKFLGEFDAEEYEVLNEFLRDFFLAKNGKTALDDEFMGIWNEAKCKLAFKRDLNGGIVTVVSLKRNKINLRKNAFPRFSLGDECNAYLTQNIQGFTRDQAFLNTLDSVLVSR